MTAPYYADETVTLLLGDACEVLASLPDCSVDCIVTSPPYYGLRDYGTEGQYGLEATPAEYVEVLRALFAEARRVLADDGTMWLNLGDSYQSSGGTLGHGPNASVGSTLREGSKERVRIRSGLPTKNLLGIPWRMAFALQDDGWILRNEIVWHKPNAMPESVRDRLSNRHEHLFMLTKQERYWFDLDAIREPSSYQGRTWDERKAAGEPMRYGTASAAAVGARGFNPHEKGRNPGDVWEIATRPYPAAHFAVFPIDIPLRAIKAGCKPGGTVLDPFSGSGTTGAAARQVGRRYVGIDLNAAYHDLARARFAQGVLDFGDAA